MTGVKAGLLMLLVCMSVPASARFIYKSKPFRRFHLQCNYSESNPNTKNKHFSVKAYSEHGYRPEDGPINDITLKIYPSPTRIRDKSQKLAGGPYYLDYVKTTGETKNKLEFSDAKSGMKFIYHGEETQKSAKADFIERGLRSELDCESVNDMFPE